MINNYRSVFIISCLITFSSGATEKPITQFYNIFGTGLELESSAEKTRATLSLAAPLSPIQNLKVDITGTIGEDDKIGSFGDLDGLSKGAKVKITYSYTNIGEYPRHPDEVYQQWDELQEVLQTIDEKVKLAIEVQKGEMFSDRLGACKTNETCKKLLEEKEVATKRLADFEKANKTILGDVDVKYPVDYLFNIAVNRSDFKVFDISDLSSESLDKNGVSVGAAIQFYKGKYTRIKLGFDFQRTYRQKGEDTEYCFPTDGVDGLLKCQSGNTNTVNREYNRNVYAQIGGYTANKYLRGWDVKLTHNVASSKTGLSIPLYFFESEKGEVNAGVKFDFIFNGDEDDDDAGVLIFFSSALDLF
jgi:hypothetical protein